MANLIRNKANCHVIYTRWLTIPYLPAACIPDMMLSIWKDICQLPSVGDKLKMKNFHEYVHRFWVQKVRPERLSMFKESRRTNNSLELIHRQMKSRLGAHKSIFKFLKDLKVHIYDPECAKVAQAKLGHIVGRKKTRQQLSLERLVN